jgi:hypothetical protein
MDTGCPFQRIRRADQSILRPATPSSAIPILSSSASLLAERWMPCLTQDILSGIVGFPERQSIEKIVNPSRIYKRCAMAKPQVHIFSLSQLVFADATDWQRILKQMREKRKNMYWSYKPLREGAFRMVSGKDEEKRTIYENVGSLAEKSGGDRCRKANLAALQTFESKFLPRIECAKLNFMQGNSPPVEFGHVQLIGGPHFSVEDSEGKERFVYLHPSRWAENQVAAFCELLTIVCEKRFAAIARDIWFLDLRVGERVPWTKSKRLLRRKCEVAAEFLATLRAANLTEDEN